MVRRVEERGVKVGVWTPTRVRAVMHLDATMEEVEQGAEAVLEGLDDAWRALGDTSEWPAVTRR